MNNKKKKEKTNNDSILFCSIELYYIVFCILGAFLIYQIYYTYLAPLWDKVISRMCETQFIKNLEKKYINFVEKK